MVRSIAFVPLFGQPLTLTDALPVGSAHLRLRARFRLRLRARDTESSSVPQRTEVPRARCIRGKYVAGAPRYGSDWPHKRRAGVLDSTSSMARFEDARDGVQICGRQPDTRSATRPWPRGLHSAGTACGHTLSRLVASRVAAQLRRPHEHSALRASPLIEGNPCLPRPLRKTQRLQVRDEPINGLGRCRISILRTVIV
jgi:hypothetical protein